jgi:hypothetical protein
MTPAKRSAFLIRDCSLIPLVSVHNRQAKKAAIMVATYRFEPLHPEDSKYALADLATDLITKASGLATRLHLREALIVGEFPRGKAPSITGYEERQARTVLTQLLGRGLLVADSPKAPVRLGFPIDVIERWFPRLYPGL